MRISTASEREWAYMEYSYGRMSYAEMVDYITGGEHD